jgi:hypothetical protein
LAGALLQFAALAPFLVVEHAHPFGLVERQADHDLTPGANLIGIA